MNTTNVIVGATFVATLAIVVFVLITHQQDQVQPLPTQMQGVTPFRYTPQQPQGPSQNQFSGYDQGFCDVRDGYTNLPGPYDPPVGKGYAKTDFVFIKNPGGLNVYCTELVYAGLMKTYCAQNKNSAQFEITRVDTNGGVTSHGCAARGCDLVSCSAY